MARAALRSRWHGSSLSSDGPAAPADASSAAISTFFCSTIDIAFLRLVCAVCEPVVNGPLTRIDQNVTTGRYITL